MDKPSFVTSGNKTFWGMNHLNGNLLCAIDTETTGFDPINNGIIEIAIVPLDRFLNPHEKFVCFHMRMKPEPGEDIDPEALRVTQLNMSQIVLEGFERTTVADYLVNWFNELGLPAGKKIMPLAANWPFDRAMIESWLGKATYESIFHPYYRDVQGIANYLNDCADMRAEKVPFAKIKLSYLCSLLKVEQLNSHTAMSDCLATAEVYKKMLSFRPELL